MFKLQDYEKLAKDIGETYVLSGGEESINSLTAKVASSTSLNPEEIRTVVRLANVTAFEKLFEKKAQLNDADRMVNFELGNPEDVISMLTNQEQELHKVASYEDTSYDVTYDMYGDIKHTSTYSMEKKAEVSKKETKDYSVLNTYQCKLASAKLREKKKQAEIAWNLALEKAAQCLMVDVGNQFERVKFEKNALACLGSDYHAEISAINMMTSPGHKLSNLFGGEKVATVLNTYVGEDNPKHSRIIDYVKQAYDARKQYNRFADGIIKLEQASFGNIA